MSIPAQIISIWNHYCLIAIIPVSQSESPATLDLPAQLMNEGASLLSPTASQHVRIYLLLIKVTWVGKTWCILLEDPGVGGCPELLMFKQSLKPFE